MRILAILALLSYGYAQFYGVNVTITYYHPVYWQTDSTPELASCGWIKDAKPWPGEKLVALSRDLFYRNGHKRCSEHVIIILDGGSVMHGYVYDTMNVRFKQRVDIMYPVGEKPGWGMTGGRLYSWWELP